jgi:hypothetical protein
LLCWLVCFLNFLCLGVECSTGGQRTFRVICFVLLLAVYRPLAARTPALRLIDEPPRRAIVRERKANV